MTDEEKDYYELLSNILEFNKEVSDEINAIKEGDYSSMSENEEVNEETS
jgi:DNA replication initiation complex subunit (GINS family)